MQNFWQNVLRKSKNDEATKLLVYSYLHTTAHTTQHKYRGNYLQNLNSAHFYHSVLEMGQMLVLKLLCPEILQGDPARKTTILSSSKRFKVLARNQSIQTYMCRMHSMQLYGIFIKYIFVYLLTNKLSQMFIRF